MKALLVSVLSLSLSSGSAWSWEATRNGPLKAAAVAAGKDAAQKKDAIDKLITFLEKDSALKKDAAEPLGYLKTRTVEYPYQSGARLGDGWDFATNSRMYTQCIEFGTAVTDGYQQANLDYTRAIDDETLSVALNVNSSAHASGGFDGFSAKASGSFGLDTSYKLASKDDIIIAHASVVNGATFVTAQQATASDPNSKSAAASGASIVSAATAPAVAGVHLSKAALATFGDNNDVGAFRAACGDGFIASIGTGADLYLMYHFSNLKNDLRVKITTSMDAGGGVTGLFDAGGSMKSSLEIDKMVETQKLGIYYIQNGGKIGALPAKLEDIADRVSKLPSEARDGGRPLYLIVVPYALLYNWPLTNQPLGLVDLRTSLIRYLQRLQTAFAELQVIIEDSAIQKGTIDQYAYLHDRFHGLRGEDYAKLNDQLLERLKATSADLKKLDDACSVKAVFRPNEAKSKPEIKHDRRRRAQAEKSCNDTTSEIVASNSFNDFDFWVKFPLPQNALSKSLMDVLVNRTGSVENRKYLMSMALYQHWIQRPTKQRCAVFGECLNREERVEDYKKIKTSLGM